MSLYLGLAAVGGGRPGRLAFGSFHRRWLSPSRTEPAFLSRSPAVWAVCLVLLALAATGSPELAVLSPQVLKRMSVEELLEQDVISVSRRPEHWGQAASSVFVVTDRTVESTGATRLPDLLRLAPNLFVAQANASNWAVNARGFVRTNSYSNKLLVLVDGRTVYSPFFSNVFWDVQDVFLPDLDRVEIISGPAGSNWGSNAVNGVINVLSKSAHETQGGLLFAGVGTEERGTFGVRYGGRFGETGAFRVYAQGRQLDATRAADGSRDDFDDSTIAQAGFRADWGETDVSGFTLQGEGYRGRTDAGMASPVRGEGAHLLGRWERDLTSDSHLSLRAYHDYAERDIQQLYIATTQTSDLEFQHRFHFGEAQQLLWGANYRRMRDEVSETVGFAILPPELTFELFGAFAQHEVAWADEKLRLTTGLRLENNHFSGWETQPSLRLAWRPAVGQTYWLAASRATRTPSRLEAGFYAPEEPPYFVAGGPNIRSETLDAYEAGVRWQPATAVSISAALFHHDYDDLRSVSQTMPVVQANGVAGRSYGVEVFVDWDVAPWWRLRAGGFHLEQDTWVKAGQTDAEQAMGEVSFPRYQAFLRNTFWLTPTQSLWLALRHVDDVPAFTGVTGRVPAYTELDATFSWEIRSGLSWSVTGRNLLETSHPEIGADQNRREIERSVQTMIRWEF